jgi:hypothetical protein
MSTTEYTAEQAKKDTDSLIPVSGERKRAKVSKLIKSILDEGEKTLSVLKSRSKSLPFSDIITIHMPQVDREEEVDPVLFDGIYWSVGLAKDYVRFLFGDKLDTGVGLNRDNFDRLATYLCTEKVVLYNADREGYINRAMLGVCSLGIALYRHIVDEMAVVDKCLSTFSHAAERFSNTPHPRNNASILEYIAFIILVSREKHSRLSDEVLYIVIDYYYQYGKSINPNLKLPHMRAVHPFDINARVLLLQYVPSVFNTLAVVDEYNLTIAEDILHYYYLFPITEQ